MTIRADLRFYLLANVAIAAVVGTRVYVTHAAQKAARPYLVIHMIDGGHIHDLDGGGGYAFPRLQINCVADDSLDVETLSDVLREQMQGFVGRWDATEVGVALLDGETDLLGNPHDAGESGIQVIAHDYIVGHEESVTAPTA